MYLLEFFGFRNNKVLARYEITDPENMRKEADKIARHYNRENLWDYAAVLDTKTNNYIMALFHDFY